MEENTKFPMFARVSLILLGLLAAITILFVAQKIIVPLVYSTIIAIVLTPMVHFLVKRKMNRILSIAIILILVIAVTLLIIFLLSTQLMQLGNSLPQLTTKFHLLLDQSESWITAHLHISTQKMNAWISEKNAMLINDFSAAIGQTLISTGNAIAIMILVIVYTFMILYYEPLLLVFVHKLFSTNNHTNVNEVLSATKRIIKSYLVGLLLEALIVASLNTASLLILGIDYAILLGVIGALLNVIPFIGGILAVTLPVLIALATKSPTCTLLVVISYVIIQFIDNHYILPKVVASKVKINALISVIVVLIGGTLWGLPGMFISIPLTAIFKLIFDRVESLKPLGYLLGDTMPPILAIKIPFKKKVFLK